MSTASRISAVFGGLALLFALSTPVQGQPALSVSAGAASYDLSGTGTTGVGAARLEWPLTTHLELQAGSSFFWYETQGDRQVAMLIPEIGLLLRPAPAAPVLVGLGVGHTVGVKGEQEDDPTLWASLGLDIEDRGGWAIRPEVRIRAVEPWVGTIGELTLGVRRTLGG